MQSLRRIQLAVTALLGVIAIGTVGYLLLGFTLLEALYQTVTTVATVGYREVQPLSPAGQVFTMVLIIVGVGAVLYNLGVIAEAVLEGHLRQQLERRRMDKDIDRLSGHVVICGYGRSGRAAAEHLLRTGHDVVVVDRNPSRLEGLPPGLLHLTGDATQDDVLRGAGLERARALILALTTDADTVYVTLSARAMCPNLVIVARAHRQDSKEKVVLAGATRAVNPQAIGGRRLAMFALQPEVGEFLDVVMHDENLDYRLEDVHIESGSDLAGRKVAELAIRERTGALMLAIRRVGWRQFEPRPDDDVVLDPGSLLIALGTQSELDALVALARASDAGP